MEHSPYGWRNDNGAKLVWNIARFELEIARIYVNAQDIGDATSPWVQGNMLDMRPL